MAHMHDFPVDRQCLPAPAANVQKTHELVPFNCVRIYDEVPADAVALAHYIMALPYSMKETRR